MVRSDLYPADHLNRHWYKICTRMSDWVYVMMDAIVENGTIGRKEASKIVKESGGDVNQIMDSELFSVGKRVRLTLYGRAVYAARKFGIRKQSLMVLSFIYMVNKKIGFYIRDLYEIEARYSIQMSDTSFRDSFSELTEKNLIMPGSFRGSWKIRDLESVEEHKSVLSAIFYKMCK